MNANNQSFTVAQLAANYVTTSTSVNKTYLKSLTAILTNPQSSSYQSVLSPIKQFVASKMGSYVVSFNTPAALTTSNIASNAWSIGFTAKPVDATNNPYQPNMQGEAVFAIGKKTYYYFFVSAVDYNWQNSANQQVFQQVINSLKIDQ